MIQAQPQKKILNVQATGVYESIVENIDAHKILCLEGGSRCFDASQKVVTKDGSKNISEISIGEFVLSGRNKDFKKVKHIFKMVNTKPCYEITLKNGKKIKATQDHKVWFEGGWHSLKYIVKCWNERNMETNSELLDV